MKHLLIKGCIGCSVILFLLNWAFITASCAPSVPQKQYDAVKTELATTKAELEKMRADSDNVSAIWTSLEPKLDMVLVVTENSEIWALNRLGKISNIERDERIQAEWAQIETLLPQINNEDFSTDVTTWWWEKSGTTLKNQSWANACNFLRTSINEDIQALSEKLSP